MKILCYIKPEVQGFKKRWESTVQFWKP